MVILHRQGKLFQIVSALGSSGGLPGSLDRWKKQRNQDPNNGDDDKQLNERETNARATRTTTGKHLHAIDLPTSVEQTGQKTLAGVLESQPHRRRNKPSPQKCLGSFAGKRDQDKPH